MSLEPLWTAVVATSLFVASAYACTNSQTWTGSISESGNDFEFGNDLGAMFAVSPTLTFGYNPTNGMGINVVFLRFLNVQVQPKTPVLSAKILFTAKPVVGPQEIELKLSVLKSRDPFPEVTNLLGLQKIMGEGGEEEITFKPPALLTESPDLKVPVQAKLDSAGWQAGDALSVAILPTVSHYVDTAGKLRQVGSFDSQEPPMLEITYCLPETPATAAIAAPNLVPTTAVPIAAQLTVEGVDYSMLVANPTMKLQFEDAVRRGIAGALSASEEGMEIALLSGSVIVMVSLPVPVGFLQQQYESHLCVSAVAIANAVSKQLAAIPGLARVATGAVSVDATRLRTRCGVPAAPLPAEQLVSHGSMPTSLESAFAMARGAIPHLLGMSQQGKALSGSPGSGWVKAAAAVGVLGALALAAVYARRRALSTQARDEQESILDAAE